MVFISSKKLKYVNVGIQLQYKQDNEKFILISLIYSLKI